MTDEIIPCRACEGMGVVWEGDYLGGREYLCSVCKGRCEVPVNPGVDK
jgi:hypothetical protein